MSSSSSPPIDRFCDLVMKGGITSGIVYPKAISLLARNYRFKSIGGTSAGAIAAVVTAAAEYQRRERDSWQGFDILEGLPDELQRRMPGTKKSKLLSLFQPQRGTRRLFAVLLNPLNRTGTYRRVLRIVSGCLRAYWPATLASFVAAWAIGLLTGSWVATALALILALLVSIGAWIYFDLTRRVVANGFGLCTGLTVDERVEALTPWLHNLIQRAAGRNPGDKPLTFGDLWDAKGYPPGWLELPASPKPRAIDLQMFSTNLSHGRPYIFPMPEADAGHSRFRTRERLFFKPKELERYLPADVLAWMCANAKPYTIEPDRKGKDPEESDADGAMELPDPRHFPVLFAARMSLSFPFLFAAVPLHAIDYDAAPGHRKFRHCWFSDGGISSNFPMHLFDGLVPLWPTFGIDLEPKIEGREKLFLPEKYETGYGERWNLFAEEEKSASRFGGFVSAIISTMQNWNDNSLARMPGVRDRVARVRLDQNEGGMNLNMEANLIAALAKTGEDAARMLVQRFTETSPDGRQTAGWDEHRLVRLNVLLKMIQARAPGVVNALNPSCRHVTDFQTLIQNAMNAKDRQGDPKAPAGYEGPLTQDQKVALDNVISALGVLATTIAAPTNSNPFKPIPNPELRVRPPL